MTADAENNGGREPVEAAQHGVSQKEGSEHLGALKGIRQRLASRPVVAGLLQNASWLVFERVALMAVGFLVNIWFIRYLGPTEFGRYSYALSFAAMFSTLAALGMDSVLVRELARHPGREGELLGTALALRLGAGSLAWAATYVAVLPVRSDTSTRAMVAIAGANALFVGAGVFELWFQARIAARALVLSRVAVTVVTQLARCMLIAWGARLHTFVLLAVASAGATALVVYAVYVRCRAADVRLSWSPQWARLIVRDSWPMIFVAIGIAVYMKIDQVMLATMASDTENGIYSPAVTLSELWYFLPNAIAASAYPIIVKAQDSMTPAHFRERLQSFYDAMAALGYSIALPIVLVAGPVVHLFYGDAYARTADVLRIHVLSLVFVCIGIARGRYLLAQNLTMFTLGATALGAVSNVLLNLVLIPRSGAVGAAWATVLAYAIANYVSGLFSRRLWSQTGMLSRSLLIPARALAYVVTRRKDRASRAGEAQGS